MAKPLDGIAFPAYVRRLGFSRETQEFLAHIRSSPPSRTPGARRGNMPVWYPSKKMQCIIKAESAKVEFAFLLATEHDDTILEIWDQPRPFRSNIETHVTASSGLFIPLITFSLGTRNVGGLSVNRHRSL